MSARVCPYLRESRVGILPKRGEDSKRKLSEQHEQTPHITHRFSTGQRRSQNYFCVNFLIAFLQNIFASRIFRERLCRSMCRWICGSLFGLNEIEDAPRLGAQKQSVGFDEDRFRAQGCAGRRQRAIRANGLAVFVEAAQFISDRDPNFLRGGINGERADLRPGGARIVVRVREKFVVTRGGREFFQSDLTAREPEAIESSHRGFGQEQENVIKISCGVGRNTAEVGTVLRASSMREISRISYGADERARVSVNSHQPMVAQRCDCQFVAAKSGDRSRCRNWNDTGERS